MKTFLITNQKGGVGKTTISVLLASKIAEKNKVLLIDSDVSQANAFEWSTSSDLEEYYSGDIYKGEYGYDVMWVKKPEHLQGQVNKKYDYIIIDGRPSDMVCMYFSKFADVIVIPFFKSRVDVKETRKFLKYLKDIKTGEIVLFYNKECREIRSGWWTDATDDFIKYIVKRCLNGRG